MGEQYHLPSQLQAAPLLITESKEDYERIRNRFMEEISPRGIIEQMYAHDIICVSWEIFRLRRSWTSIINSAFGPALRRLLVELLPRDLLFEPDESEAAELALGWFSDEKGRDKVLEILERHHLDETAIEAEAIRLRLPDLERMDKLITSRECQRDKTLQGIAEYRTDLMLRLRAGSDRIINGKALAVEHTNDIEAPVAGVRQSSNGAADSGQPS